MLVSDQDGNEFDFVNKYNFSVLQIGGGVTRSVDINSNQVTLESVEGTNKRVVSLGLDNSGSMASVDFDTGKTTLQLAKEAATLFVDGMRDQDKAAVVKFSDVATILAPLTTDKDALIAAIDTLEPEGSTNIGDCLIKCTNVIGAYPGKTAIVLLTDGADNGLIVPEGIKAAKKAKVKVFTIGIGAFADEATLTQIADETGGEYFPASTTNLSDVFSVIIPAAIDKIPVTSRLRLRVPLLTPLPRPFEAPYSLNLAVTVKFRNARAEHSTTLTGTVAVQE